MSILSLWEMMSHEPYFGLVKRLYKRTSSARVYAIYDHTTKMCGIALSYSGSINIDVTPFNGLSELSVKIYNDQSNKLLAIQLISNSNKDIFAALCDNLIYAIEECNSEKDAVRLVLNRLEKWKTLLKKGASEELSKKEQLGLYGELTYLDELLNRNCLHPLEMIKFWVGSDKALRDFQGDEWAVEVKTTSTNNPYQITINGERQLDDSFFQKLYLYHLSVEVSERMGETLNAKVESIRDRLQRDVIALNVFNDKLMEVGYFDFHKDLYESRCYKIRQVKIYHVHDAFPRIRENELREGVSNVVYSINVSNCEIYLVREDNHFENIK